MAFNLRFRDLLPDAVVDEFDSVLSALKTFLNVEHNEDGSHADVVADSLTLQAGRVGEVVDLPYDAARFFPSGSAVWTVSAGDVNYFRACRVGQIVHIWFSFKTMTTTSDTSSELNVRLPEFHAIPMTSLGTALVDQTYNAGSLWWYDTAAGTDGIGVASAVAQPLAGMPSTVIQLSRISPTNATLQSWPISANFDITGHLCFPVNVNNAPLAYSF